MRIWTRLTLAAAIAAAAWAGTRAQTPAAAPAARIKIDIDRAIGEVHPHLFGNFAEHLGRMIYGGIYEEGSPLSDADGFRRDVLDAVRGLGVSILRWPGGNFVSGYNWKDGIGPKDARPVRAELAWNALETNRFGTDEFLRYAERIGAEPYICVNLGLGTIDDARHWVEYTNETRGTYWADQRRKNGRAEPWNVKYWALGNEIDGPWQLGHKTADEYARFAREAGRAMRAVDPGIKLVASGSSNYGADWIGWNRTVLYTLRNVADYIAIHTYINNRDNDFERYMAWSQTIEHYIEVTAGLIKQAQSGQREPRAIAIAYDEWNVWYRTGEKEGLEEIYNFEDALAMGMFFNAFFRHAEVVKMANVAQMVNVIAPIITDKAGLFLQTTYFPIVEYGKQRGNLAIDAWVSAPTYRVANRPPLPYLDVSATYDSRRREICVNVLNRSKDRDIAAVIENQEGRLAGDVAVWELNHPDLKATHTFGADRTVRPVTRAVRADAAANRLTYTFPAHSLTILRMQLQ
ncbi:MAG TPA: alpha-L-arabinofuranosidase C-terminal domain-containing protein [Vicinamibacterales bacterium]|nr:alpha-L-arabinofuranosidase C-terminal domain-containing protein [Vicinamibacterales bacterium]